MARHCDLLHLAGLLVWFGSTVMAVALRQASAGPPAIFESRGPGGGGAFFSPSFSPHSPKEIFVASDMSGVYHTADSGASWKIQDFRQLQGGRPTAVQFTSDPQVLYAIDVRDEGVAPAKSMDAGTTWQRLAGVEGAQGLIADPGSKARLIAWNAKSMFFSADGGKSFTVKYSNSGSTTGTFVAGAFFDDQNIYVGTNSCLLLSTDGGQTFARSPVTGVPAGKAMFSFCGAKQSGRVRLYTSLLNDADVHSAMLIEAVAKDFAGIYSLDIGDGQWSPRAGTIARNIYPTFVSTARNDVNTVYVAGTGNADVPVVIKSTDAGAHWSSALQIDNNLNTITGWQGAGGDRGWGYGGIALGLAVSPVDANSVCFTDDGFVHISADGGATWRQAYVSPSDQNLAGRRTPQHKAYHGVGLEDTSALWLTWVGKDTLVAGYTDIYGARSRDGGASWAFPNFNPPQNTIYQISSSPDGTLYAASSSIHDLYQSTHLTDRSIDRGIGRIQFSTDAGARWNTLHDFGHPVVYTSLDPTDTKRLYAAVAHSSEGGIYLTNNLEADEAATWSKLASPPRTEGHPYVIRVLKDGALVVTYSGRRTTRFTESSGVFLSNDRGQTWLDRTDTTLSGMRFYTKDITVDPNDAAQNTWYVAVRSGWGGYGNNLGGLYRTSDRGQHWTRIFSADSCESVTIVPGSGELYLATLGKGLWYSPGGASPKFTPVDRYPFRQPHRVFINPHDPDDLWVTSFGYGLAEGRTTK